MKIVSLSAVTLSVSNMEASVNFYLAAGFLIEHGGIGSDFTTLSAGNQFLNLQLNANGFQGFWGRVIFFVDDVDKAFKRVIANKLDPQFAPRNGPWGERYFHLRDPDGHEISFAHPLT